MLTASSSKHRPAALALALLTAILLAAGATQALYAASVSALVITVTPGTVAEGGQVTVEVGLSNAVFEGPVTVNVQTFDGTPGPGGAQAASDYTAVSTTLQFLAGETKKTLTVDTTADLVDEANEVFDVEATLGSAPGGVTVLGTPRATVVIQDDDSQTFTGFSGPASVAEGAGTAAFTLTLGAVTAQAVQVDYTVLAGAPAAATPGADTAVASGTWYIPAGSDSAGVTLGIVNDTIYEGDEHFSVRIDAVTGALFTPPLPTLADITIVDDEAVPTVSVAPASVAEGTGGSTSLAFTVSLSHPSAQPVTFTYSTADGTALAAGDYTAQPAGSGPATIAAGAASATVSVPVNPDALDEDDETFTLTISNASGATIGAASATGTIVDDDTGPEMTINSVTMAEGDAGTTDAVFTVSLSSASGRDVSVTYATADGSAAQPADYTAAGGTLTIGAGNLTGEIRVPVLGDTLDEDDETFTVALSGAVNATLAAGASGAGTITDDDAPPQLFVDDATLAAEGNSGTTTLPVTVRLVPASGRPVLVELSTADGSAVAPADYTAVAPAAPVLVSFAAGETSKTVNLSVAGDTLDEDDETFTVALASPSNATLGDGTAAATITDDDAQPSLSVNDISVNEGDAPATATGAFTLQLSAPSGRAVSVNVATADGSATQPGDYTQIASTPVTIPAGQLSATVDVTVVGDALYEGAETFTLGLAGAANASIADASGTATIVDDDRPTVSFASASSSAGEGAGSASVTVELSSPVVAGDTVTVSFAAAGSAGGADYTIATASPLTFSAGQSSRTIDLTIADDLLNELAEDVVLTLSSPNGATLGAVAQHTLTIADNDPEPAVRFAAAESSVSEGAGSANVTVELSAPSGRSVTVAYSVSDGTAAAPADYSATASGTLTFAPGVTSQTIAVTVVDDSVSETSETVLLAISGPSGATLGAAAHTLRIDDNDGPPQVLFDRSTGTVSESGGAATVDVVLTAAAGEDVSVSFAQTGGTATGADYSLATASPLTFAPGETRKTITITISGNGAYELDRTLVLGLSGLTTTVPGVTLGATSEHTLTIEDDDGPAVSFAAASASAAEGAGTYTVAVQLSQALLPGDSATVTLTRGGSAASPADYDAPAVLNLTSASGTNPTFDITLVDNQVDAADKTVVLTLAPAAGSNLSAGAPATFTLTIQDDDETPVAADDAHTLAEDGALTLAAPGVLGNDSDGDGDALAAVKLTDPAHGTLTLGADGSLTYTPAANYHGADSFTYRAQDPGGNQSNIATVQITVTPVNDAPQAAADSYTTPEGVALVLAAPGVLGNDSDADGDALSAVKLSDPANGTLTLGADGSLTYTPNPGYKGADTFAYQVSDGALSSAPVTVTVRVGLSYLVMAPIVYGLPGTPDLVASLELSPAGPSFRSTQQVTFTVTVTNTGTGATENGFWVDLYINPGAPPVGPNLTWNQICGIDPCRGLAWYVGRILQPGESVTLSSAPGGFDRARSIWEGRLPSGARSVYVYVDSWNPGVSTGAVRERSEANNRVDRTDIRVDGAAVAAKSREVVGVLPRP